MSFDTIIAGAAIYDGNGGAPILADVGIRGDRIAAIGDLSNAEAEARVEGAGMALLPGLIDVHTHSDSVLLLKPDRAEALCQGITTEITGACGIGLFPLTNRFDDYARLSRGLLGDLPRGLRFASTNAYLEALPNTGVNVAAQLAHSPLRAEAQGFSDAPMHPSMLDMARRAFEEGAVGLTTGLSYYPASFSDTDEIVELCKIAAAFGAPLAIHRRSVLRKPDPAFDRSEEALSIARRSGVHVQFSHFSPSPGTAGKLDAVLSPIERGLREGLSLSADFYPYPVGASYGLFPMPLWAMEGDADAIMERLSNPETRARIEAEMDVSDIQDAVVTHAPNHPTYLGKRLFASGKSLCQMNYEEELALAFRWDTDAGADVLETLDRDAISQLQKPYCMAGSDTLPAYAFPHPRSFGAFARFIRLAHEQGAGMALVANRMAKYPAEMFGLRDRGEIAEGKFADLILFDPAGIRDRATFAEPKQLAEGMKMVYVNGKLAVKDGKPTGALNGRALRRGV